MTRHDTMNNKLPPLPPTSFRIEGGLSVKGECIDYTADQMRDYALAAITAQAGQSEPVAHQYQLVNGMWYPFLNDARRDNKIADGQYRVRALYDHPAPVRQPLSDDQITEMAHRMATTYTHRTDPTSHAYGFVRHTLINFIRAIEAAHGITEKKDEV